ncbi:MAG: DUF2470 domain-containing protein [Actinomycetota bacterium]
MSEDQQIFGEQVVAAVMSHMNQDHASDSLVICKGLGGAVHADRAQMSGMDPGGIEFTVWSATQALSIVRIPWNTTPVARSEIRTEVVQMYQKASANLGLDLE